MASWNKCLFVLVSIHLLHCHGRQTFFNLTILNETISNLLHDYEECLDKSSSYISHLNYTKEERPESNKDPVKVGIKLYLMGLSHEDAKSEHFTVDIHLRQFWVDPRLKTDTHDQYKVSMGGADLANDIWRPDTRVNDARILISNKGHDHDQKTFVRISRSSGEVLWTQRLDVSASCPHEMGPFPLESQSCSFSIKTSEVSTGKVVYHWQDGPRSVVVSSAYSLPDILVTQTDVGVGSKENVSHLVSSVTLVRVPGHYVSKIYIPVVIIMVINWVTFWISPNRSGARLLVSAVAQFCIMFVKIWINICLPVITHSFYINIYLDVCVLLVFLTVIEFLIVVVMEKNNLKKCEKHRKVVMERMAAQHERMSKLNTNEDDDKKSLNPERFQLELEDTPLCPNLLDRISRLLFPGFFLVFQFLSYWVDLYRDFYSYPVMHSLVLKE